MNDGGVQLWAMMMMMKTAGCLVKKREVTCQLKIQSHRSGSKNRERVRKYDVVLSVVSALKLPSSLPIRKSCEGGC